MPLIDERGRLFGRMNLIDALIALVAVVLIPIAYMAFALFRTPAPRITSVDPGEVPLGQEMRVKVRGTGLRSLFRANIGEIPATAYLFENERSADVLFSHVNPGKYDLSLYDGVQEVSRIKNAVTVLPPPTPPTTKIRLIGTLIALDEGRARQLARGQHFPASGAPVTEILNTAAPRPDELYIKAADVNVALTVNSRFQVPVLLRTDCELVDRAECRIAGLAVGAGVIVPVPGTDMRIRIDTVRPDVDAQPAEIVVHVVADPDLAASIKIGDAEDSSGVDVDHAATVAAILNKQSIAGERATRLNEASSDASVEAKTPERFTACDVVLRLGLDPWGAGWRHRGQVIRVGAPLLLTTNAYVVRGTIQKVTIKGAPQPAAHVDQ